MEEDWIVEDWEEPEWVKDEARLEELDRLREKTILESQEQLVFEWPQNFDCPIFKAICFRDLTHPRDRIEMSADRCPCGYFNLGNDKGVRL